MHTQRTLSLLIVALALLLAITPIFAQDTTPYQCVALDTGALYGNGQFADTETGQWYTVLVTPNETYSAPDESAAARFDVYSINAQQKGLRLLLVRDGQAPQVIRSGVRDDFDFGDNPLIGQRLLWSPDSRAFAYYWHNLDGTAAYVSVYSLDSGIEETLPYDKVSFAITLVGWSADSRYFSLEDYDSAARTGRLTVYSRDPLTLHSTDVGSDYRVWSPTRPEYASATVTPDHHVRLTLTPMDGFALSRLIDATDVGRVWWSPDGDTLAPISRSCTDCAAPLWQYHLLHGEGMPITALLSGISAAPAAAYSDRPDPSAVWSADGGQFYWFEQVSPGMALTLRAVNTATGELQNIVENVRAEDVPSILAAALLNGAFAHQAAAAETFQADTLIVPHFEESGGALEVVDLLTGDSTTLVTGLHDLQSMHRDRFSIIPGTTWFYFLSSTADATTPNPNLITLVNGTTRQYTSFWSENGDYVDNVRWSDAHHLIFSSQWDDTGHLYSIDVRAPVPVLWGETTSDEWRLTFSPTDPALAVLQVSSETPQGSLFLKREGEDMAILISENAPYRPVWSPDGERFAVDEFLPEGHVILIADRNGEIITRIPMVENGDWLVQGFTDCGW